MALSKRTDIRRVSAAAVFAATTSIAYPLYLAILSEQTASDPAWLTVAETLAERHGGETLINMSYWTVLSGIEKAIRSPEFEAAIKGGEISQ